MSSLCCPVRELRRWPDASTRCSQGRAVRCNYRVQVINAFLALMDEITHGGGVIVIATCNHRDLIDPAVLRAGRFDKQIAVLLPDAAMLADVLRRHVQLTDAEAFDLAHRAVGLSLAELDTALRGLRAGARRAGRALTAKDLPSAFDDGRNPALEFRIAVHECGHALTCAALGRGTVERIALDRSGGLTQTAGSHSDRRQHAGLISDHEALLVELMAARAAEQLIFSDVSSGTGGPAESDLAEATRAALAIETRYGLGHHGPHGPLWLADEASALMRDPATHARLRARIEAAEARAAQILAPHRAPLEDMARALTARRELTAEAAAPWLQQIKGVAARRSVTAGR